MSKLTRFFNPPPPLKAEEIFEPSALTIDPVEAILTLPRHQAEAAIRSRAKTAYLGHDDVLCRILGRYYLFADARDVGLSPHLMFDGFWEFWVTHVFARLVKPGMTVADVGANLGYYSLLFHACLKGQGVVHAVEPNPPIVDRLRRSLSVNGVNARIHAVPLWSKDGVEITFRIPAGEPKNAHITAEAAAATPAQDGGGAGDLKLTTRSLDSLFSGQKLDFLKIDVEGAEYEVWLGMQGLLKANPALISVIEINYGRENKSLQIVEDALRQKRWVGYIRNDARVLPVTPDQIVKESPNEDWLVVIAPNAIS